MHERMTAARVLCFLCCILGKITGIICIVILPDIVKMEEQKAASFRYLVYKI